MSHTKKNGSLFKSGKMTDLAPEARPSYWREQRERQKLVFYILQTFMIFLLYNKLFVKSVRYGQR